jgi:predicted PurR-regulated permease PerM
VDLRISTRTIVRSVLVIGTLALAAYALWLVRDVVLLVVLAIVVALALGPPVGWLSRHGVRRGAAILLVYLGIVLSIFGVGMLFVPPLVDGVQQLSTDVPASVHDLRRSPTLRKYDDRFHVTAKLEEQAANAPDRLGAAAGKLRSLTVGVFGAGVDLVTVMALAFFFLLDGRRMVAFGLRALGEERSARLEPLLDEIYRATAAYVGGNVIISVCAGTVTWITLTVLGVPFAVPLAVLVGFLDMIPMVGATIGGVAVGLVTLTHGFPTSTIVWATVLIVYQQIENTILQPLVYGRTVDVHPLMTLISILVGASLLGVLGALIAIPVAAAVQIVARELWRGTRFTHPA